MLEAGAQQAVLEASAAREEPRDELPQALVSTAGHPQLPPNSFCPPWEAPGNQGLLVTVWPWQCHLPAFLESLGQQNPAGTATPCPQAPHTTEGSPRAQPDTANIPIDTKELQQPPVPQPWHPCHTTWPTLGAAEIFPVPPPGGRAVAWSQDDAQAQLWLRKAGGMDQSSQPSTFPWLLTGSTGAGISVRGKLRQGQHLSSFPVSLPWLCYMSPQQ